MYAGALCSAWNIVWCSGRCQDLVNHVDDTVTGVHISKCDGSIVDHDAVTYGKGNRITVDSVGCEALRNCSGWNLTSNYVVEQDVGERCLAFSSIESRKVDSGISKGLVRRCKQRERSRSLKRHEKFSLDNPSNKRIVNPGALCRSWNVVGRIGWGKHFVDNMNESVACTDICLDDSSAVHHNSSINGERQGLTVCGSCGHTISNIRCWYLSGYNVVKKNVGKCSLAFGSIECCQINPGINEGLVGRCEDRERSWTLKSFKQFSLYHSCNQRIM